MLKIVSHLRCSCTVVRSREGVEPTRNADDVIVGDLTGADDQHRYVPAGHVATGFRGPVDSVGVTKLSATPGDRPEGRSRSVALHMAQYSPGSEGDSSDEWVVDQ